MDIDQLIREGLQKLAQGVSTQVRIALVTSVDKGKAVCEAQLVDSEVLVYNIRLRATDDQADEGLIMFPKVGSYILICQIANDGGWLMLMGSEYQALSIKRNGKELGQVLVDLIGAMKNLSHATAVGESAKPTNLPEIVQVEQSLKAVFGL